ncbi:MAG: response regulator [Synechocystis sp.]
MPSEGCAFSDRVPLILVVDDDRSIRTLLNLAIEEEGYLSIEAKDGEHCLTEYKRRQPDMVLLDAVMPEMDGFTCCQQLRQLPGGDRLPILMITVLDDQESVDRAFAAGATDYITKPIHWGVLSQRMQRLLSSTQLALQLEQAHQWQTVIRQTIQRLAQATNQKETLLAILTDVQECLGVQRLFLRKQDNSLCLEVNPENQPSIEALPWETLTLGHWLTATDRPSQGLTIPDIHQAEVSPPLISQLTAVNTEAVLLIPVLMEGELWGILGVHQSQALAQWSPQITSQLTDIANLISLALKTDNGF